MENLHSDFLENILSRLPTKEALHAKRVCTTWREILRKKTERSGFLFAFFHAESNNKVRKQLFYGDEYDHYDHANINHYYSDRTLSKIQHGKCIMKSSPRDIMVGSCNGLVLIGKYNRDALGLLPSLICNPLTRESVFLPDYSYSKYPQGHVSNGFGYSPSTNKYKVVTLHCNQNNHKGHFQVYTIGGKWRYIGSIRRFNHSSNAVDCSTGIYANGALHWLHKSDPYGQERQIVALDMESERFRYIALPLSDQPPPKLLGGKNNLYLCYTITDYVSYRTDIWAIPHIQTSLSLKDLGETNVTFLKDLE
ncbi:F-box/kelch-repeat protein At3g23880-like [Papaver somniferum]|uniref:F-box/kelch-repeat protein At3g23880-like n=1 Tax=Papaver somniferum TaxID=3469 RepID=UPI000E6F9B30|nr:F-box/kelch-repeat protein At3g23880-like [Papaver somniferum]